MHHTLRLHSAECCLYIAKTQVTAGSSNFLSYTDCSSKARAKLAALWHIAASRQATLWPWREVWAMGELIMVAGGGVGDQPSHWPCAASSWAAFAAAAFATMACASATR